MRCHIVMSRHNATCRSETRLKGNYKQHRRRHCIQTTQLQQPSANRTASPASSEPTVLAVHNRQLPAAVGSISSAPRVGGRGPAVLRSAPPPKRTGTGTGSSVMHWGCEAAEAMEDDVADDSCWPDALGCRSAQQSRDPAIPVSKSVNENSRTMPIGHLACSTSPLSMSHTAFGRCSQPHCDWHCRPRASTKSNAELQVCFLSVLHSCSAAAAAC